MNNFTGTIQVLTDLVYIVGYQVNRATLPNTILGAGGVGAGNSYTIGDDDGDGLINEDRPDGVDNDNDGFTDCQDYQCQNNPIASSVCLRSYENTLRKCDDNFDNDGDGLIDEDAILITASGVFTESFADINEGSDYLDWSTGDASIPDPLNHQGDMSYRVSPERRYEFDGLS